jgi:regulator of protease activity HflC (stomatin/prohibitin superfamily)
MIAETIAVTFALAAALAVVATLRVLVRRVVVHDWEAALLYRNGRFVRRLATGAHRFLAHRHEVVVLDTRRRLLTVAGQEVLSADAVGLKVSVAVAYEIADPVRALHATQSHEEALHVAVQLAIRSAVAAAKIDELLAQRIEIGRQLADVVGPQADALGLRLHTVDVKDVMFPGELKKIFAEVVRAQKEGQAALERARGETAALRSLANAARLVEESPGLMNLRVLQSVAGAAAGGGTLVMGVPQGLVPLAGRRGAAKAT